MVCGAQARAIGNAGRRILKRRGDDETAGIAPLKQNRQPLNKQTLPPLQQNETYRVTATMKTYVPAQFVKGKEEGERKRKETKNKTAGKYGAARNEINGQATVTRRSTVRGTNASLRKIDALQPEGDVWREQAVYRHFYRGGDLNEYRR